MTEDNLTRNPTHAEGDEIWAKIQKQISDNRPLKGVQTMNFYKAIPTRTTLDLVNTLLQRLTTELLALRDASEAGVELSEDHREFRQTLMLAGALASEMNSVSHSSSMTLVHLLDKARELGARIQDDAKCQGCGGTSKAPGSLAACPWCTGPDHYWCPKCGHSFSTAGGAMSPRSAKREGGQSAWPLLCPQCDTPMQMETMPERP